MMGTVLEQQRISNNEIKFRHWLQGRSGGHDGIGSDLFQWSAPGPVLISADPSDSIRRMAARFSGNFSNEEQVQSDIDNGRPPRNLHFFLHHPIQMSLFGEDNETFYYEHKYNEYAGAREILVLGENDEGVIRINTFNLRIPLPNGSWSVDISSLENLTMEDLVYKEGCDPIFYEIDTEQGDFFGRWPECYRFPPEMNLSHSEVITCEGIFFLDPGVGEHMSSPVPMIVKPSERYPLKTYSYEGAGKTELCGEIKL